MKTLKFNRKANIISTLLILTALLSACGNLKAPKNGTYKSDDGILSQTWTFSGKDEITISAGGGLIATHGTYSINGEKLTVTTSLFGVESKSGYKITEIKSKSFFIDGTKFEKQ